MSNIISETCEATFEALKTDCLRVLKDSEDCEKISEKYKKLWDFSNALGAINGKHIHTEHPKNSE